MNDIQKMRIEVRLEDAFAEWSKYEALKWDALEKEDYDRVKRIEAICSAKNGEYSGMLSVLNVLGYGIDHTKVDGVDKIKIVPRTATILMNR